MKDEIKCLSFLNGETIICIINNDIISNAFNIKTYTDKESKERSFIFNPILKCKYDQNLNIEESKNLLNNKNLISCYEPANTVKNAYKSFIETEQFVGQVMWKYLCECGPSKQWVDKLNKELEEANAHLPKRKPISDGNIIKGAFGPHFEVFEE